ncbi:MAG TPA: excinuclease ABC subunit UvrA [Polyangiaceae bacterium]|nr:excinuclease ABC subunit UvrA [Polyangiaceae bacterium]
MLRTVLEGAETHNLKGVDLELVPGEVVAVAGVSGSGKSSLAIDTLYSEGQRRFVESFSPYARQFLERLERPPTRRLEPVPAGIAVDRRAPVKSSRSTVASMADIQPYLAALFLREAQPVCPEHGVEARFLDPRAAAERVTEALGAERATLTYSVPVADKERYLEVREALIKDGYRRVFERGVAVDLDELAPSRATKAKTLEVVLDRLQPSRDAERLAQSIEAGWSRAAGLVSVHGETTHVSVRQGFGCPECGRALEPPRSGLFSYESALGACAECRGFGRTLGIDVPKVLPDPSLSLAGGVIRPWRGRSTKWERAELAKMCKRHGIPLDRPFAELSAAEREIVLNGDGSWHKGLFPGVLGWFKWLETKAYKLHVRVLLSRYRSYDVCRACAGQRLNATALAYRVGGKSLAGWNALEISGARALIDAFVAKTGQGEIARSELAHRLGYLEKVGLGYLTLDRQARTLSGGEAQRVTLTAALGTSLESALFVLDEPTVGLHPSDVPPVNAMLKDLASRDNVVLVVEHDPVLLRSADRIVELGPGAGSAGGHIVRDAPPSAFTSADTATGRALGGARFAARTPRPAEKWLEIKGARANNLRDVSAKIPLGVITAITGPSGSGKSTLAVDVLYRALARSLGDLDVEPAGEHARLAGASGIARVTLVDQLPLGRTSRGNAATYTKAWDSVRALYAKEPEAVAKHLGASHFSFNVEDGRCPSCAGEGYETVEMQFLADVRLLCPVCQGKRFQERVLAVRHRGVSIAELLDFTVDDAVAHFAGEAAILRALGPVQKLGLGYLRLGQPLSTFSGGEAQRLKLARALAEKHDGALVILDEPSAGLHADEVVRVVDALDAIVTMGGSVIVVEHDLDLVNAADWVIDLGPGAGSAGGSIVATGTPADVARTETRTGVALREHRTRAADAGTASAAASTSDTAVAPKNKASPRARLKNGAPNAGNGAASEWSLGRGARRVNGTDSRRNGGVTHANGHAARAVEPRSLAVSHAREHNLKDVSLGIPHGSLTVVTGPSGSGKSTLAFDVVFAEGQRRFLETLTPYARQFLPTMPRPDVDAVTGIPPAIALEQRTARAGGSSTVATVTEVAHYLRLLYAKVGTPHCPDHDTAIERTTRAAVTEAVRRVRGKRWLLAPVVKARKGTYLDVFTAASRGGIELAFCDGTRVYTESPPKLKKALEHDIDLVIAGFDDTSTFDDATLERALLWGEGELKLRTEAGSEQLFSTTSACPKCGFSVPELDPRFFSFNTKQGRCETCEGAGVIHEEERVGRGKKAEIYLVEHPCPACDGARLAPVPRAVRLEGERYHELTARSVRGALARVREWSFEGDRALVAKPVVAELVRRLEFLDEVGLGYLALDRAAGTLSGGEMQRLRLAAQLGAGLTGALYVLDEPTIGLHPRDTGRLLGNLRRLVDLGSTVLVVEHDIDTIRAADHLVDLGPGGGARGGRIVAEGSPAAVLANAESPTGRALAADPKPRAALGVPRGHAMLELTGASEHNLKGVDLAVPLGRFVVVAGVSGSGKSTLVRQVLLPAVRQALGLVTDEPGAFAKLAGHQPIARALSVDQSPIGRTPRSVPATFLGIWDPIRRLFAAAPEAKMLGFDPSRFSFNTPKGGRCTTCEGQGALTHEMSFLPDVVTACPACGGQRFEPQTLTVRYRGLSAGDVLALTAEEAVRVFEAHPTIVAPLQTLCDLGAGYITLGQGSHTLSGGEAQRLKLATELTAGSRHEHTLYVLDEPTTGLHVADVEKLVHVLGRLVERGDTLIVIEHHPQVMAGADWLIELGPDGGDAGGRIVAAGAPRDVAKKKTATGGVLAAMSAV